MEVGKSTTDALGVLTDFSDDDYKQFLTLVFQSLTSEGKEEKALPKSVPAKQAFAALSTIILEAAKHDAGPTEITSVLSEDGHLTDGRIKLFVSLYQEQRAALRAWLARTGISWPSVIGLSWRLDYTVKGDLLEQTRQPLYFLSLKTQQPDGCVKDVEFTANAQELQDLLHKLKDAEHQAAKRAGAAAPS